MRTARGLTEAICASDLTDDEWQLVEPLGDDKRSDHARDCEQPHVYLYGLSVAGDPERPATSLDVVRLFDLWSWDPWRT